MRPNVYRLLDDNLENKLKEDFGNQSGVYLMFCKINGQVKQIPRALLVDENGILYIGKGVNLKRRVLQLHYRILESKRQHSGGSRYNSNHNLQNAFPKENRYIELFVKEDARGSEEKLLFDYIKKFGELPPLNRQR